MEMVASQNNIFHKKKKEKNNKKGNFIVHKGNNISII
jgi:hypothetical protein